MYYLRLIMGRIAMKLELSETQQAALEAGYRSDSHTFSKRCQMILLKSKGFSLQEIAKILGTNYVSVSKWISRYKSEGISGLRTRPGRGRPSILDTERDAEQIIAKVHQERQRLNLAKDELEANLGKSFSLMTLKRFLKDLVTDGNEQG